MLPRSTVFIGTSKEGLATGEAIQINLEYIADCVLWSQGVFGLMEGTLETLVKKVDQFDFAILVLTPDDTITSRDVTKLCSRDNILFELGLFIGALGRERTFAVYDRSSDIHIPSDLAGITLLDFVPHRDGNLQASLGAPCTKVKQCIETLGPKPRLGGNVMLSGDESFRVISDLLDDSDIQFILLLKDIDTGIPRNVRSEFESYGGKNSLQIVGYFTYDLLCKKLPDAGILQQDLRNVISLTPRGREYAAWLIERGYKAKCLMSEFGGWGEPPEDAIRPGKLE